MLGTTLYWDDDLAVWWDHMILLMALPFLERNSRYCGRNELLLSFGVAAFLGTQDKHWIKNEEERSRMRSSDFDSS